MARIQTPGVCTTSTVVETGSLDPRDKPQDDETEGDLPPLIGRALEVPPALDALLQRPAQALPMPPDYDALHDHLLAS